MKEKLITSLKKFAQDDSGPTAVEYAVMLSLIVIVCLTAITSIATSANSAFQAIANSIQGQSLPLPRAVERGGRERPPRRDTGRFTGALPSAPGRGR